jgi:hypothetical protein
VDVIAASSGLVAAAVVALFKFLSLLLNHC